jgi:phage major head subunit gpT-like protein
VLSEENSILFANSIDRISDEDKKFRDLLEVGSVIEAVKIEPVLNCKSWSSCVVKQKSSDNKIKISFENDSQIYDREIGIYAPDISEISEKSKSDQEFRDSLKVGDFVDCYDSTKFWYASTIVGIDTREF